MHEFINFKGFKYSRINLFNPLTVLIGSNGSGKSNIIEGVELLAGLVHGRPLHEIEDFSRWSSGRYMVRGGIQSCARYGQDNFGLGFIANMQFMGKNRPFHYMIRCETKPKPRILSEELKFTTDNTMIFKTIEKAARGISSDITVEYNNFAKGGHKPHTSVSEEVSIISQYKEFARRTKKYNDCMRVVSGIMKWLESSFVFDPNPKSMRSYERIGYNTLLRNGENLSAVLYGLSKGNQEEQESLKRISEWIRQLPEEPFGNFEFVTTRLSDVIFGLKEGNDGHITDARLLSDGTLRCLAVLTAVETVANDSRVVIEEFDNGLHPSRVRVLLDAISSCCERKKLNVLVTTHNPATLNALKDDQLAGVVFCMWNSEIKSFDLVDFNNLPRFYELLERGRLGDLVTRRIIEQHMVPRFEEDKKDKALKWLGSLDD